jgi:hypothetical protein
MSGEIEAMGDAVHGGLLATAVDAAATSADAGDAHGACPNCTAPLTGAFCASCGQSAHLHRSLAGFGHDLLHGVLHFEGRIWHTLPLLAWRPGDLTRRYIHGERAKFVSPLALFLFAVFLLFATSEMTLGKPHFTPRVADPVVNLDQVEERLQAAVTRQRTALADSDIDADRRTELQAALARTENGLAAVDRARAALVSERTPDGSTPWDAETLATIRTNIEQDSEIGSDFAQALQNAGENPDLLLYKIKTNAYKFAWALIPLSLPFVWFAMIGRGMRQRHFYDYAVFTTYSIAFMLLLLVAVLLATSLLPASGWIAFVAFLYAPFHLYRQVRHTWRLSRISALVRTLVMMLSGIIVLVTFMSALVAMGLGG